MEHLLRTVTSELAHECREMPYLAVASHAGFKGRGTGGQGLCPSFYPVLFLFFHPLFLFLYLFPSLLLHFSPLSYPPFLPSVPRLGLLPKSRFGGLRSTVSAEPRPQKLFALFWAQSTCLVATILILFVEPEYPCEPRQVAQLSQRDRTAGWVSFGQSGRRYSDNIIGLFKRNRSPKKSKALDFGEITQNKGYYTISGNRLKTSVFEGMGQFGRKFQEKGLSPSSHFPVAEP